MMGKWIEPDSKVVSAERILFEAAGKKMYGWDEHDFRRGADWDGIPRGHYTWETQRKAFALWLYAKNLLVAA